MPLFHVHASELCVCVCDFVHVYLAFDNNNNHDDDDDDDLIAAETRHFGMVLFLMNHFDCVRVC